MAILDLMVKNPEALERFELELERRTPHSYAENLRIVQALYEEARSLGTFVRADPLEGIETKIELAQAINRV